MAVDDTGDHRDMPARLTLDSERFDVLVRVIETPPAPGPKLKALLRRVPAWEKAV